MIIMNACSTVKIHLDDTNEFSLFSIIPNPDKDFQLHLLDGVITDQQSAHFLRDFPTEWLWHDDGQLLGVRVDAPQEVCRDFLKSRVVDTEILLNDEECTF